MKCRGVVEASLGTVDPKTWVQIPAPAFELLLRPQDYTDFHEKNSD